MIPDILRNIQDNKKIIIRNPEHVRPWQDILDVLNGYLLLAEKLHQNYKYSGPWNFGPQKIKNKNVLKITRLVLKEFNFKKGYKIEKSKNKQEEFFLFLDSQKSRKELNWHTKIKTQTSVNNIYKWSKHSKNYKLRKYFSDNLIKNYFNIKF